MVILNKVVIFCGGGCDDGSCADCGAGHFGFGYGGGSCFYWWRLRLCFMVEVVVIMAVLLHLW